MEIRVYVVDLIEGVHLWRIGSARRLGESQYKTWDNKCVAAQNFCRTFSLAAPHIRLP